MSDDVLLDEALAARGAHEANCFCENVALWDAVDFEARKLAGEFYSHEGMLLVVTAAGSPDPQLERVLHAIPPVYLCALFEPCDDPAFVLGEAQRSESMQHALDGKIIRCMVRHYDRYNRACVHRINATTASDDPNLITLYATFIRMGVAVPARFAPIHFVRAQVEVHGVTPLSPADVLLLG